MFLGCVFGVVKRVEARLILGGAREPSEARPGRSGTLQKTKKQMKKTKKINKNALGDQVPRPKSSKRAGDAARGSCPVIYNKV